LGATEVVAFLNHLANREHVAAATQNQALNAISPALAQTLAANLQQIRSPLAHLAITCFTSSARIAKITSNCSPK
jgi:hypothetical protein